MFEEYQICPYTGLRSFSEEESLYFKGREEHIEEATVQLQRNKFLMLTGASGDGKSSLVYAGIIPNARAGFLKSKYSQWRVADFRPERSPFKNLCKSLANQLGIANTKTVEAELHHGFSALVDLYKNSKCYIDTNAVDWQQADDKGKAILKREASNLIVIVDQFEEFFTNPENYKKGVPSRSANLVLNLLLETARIALEENLPIYVIFTMRSDFIGQCAAFRGLPEYIGFSQFFVPRLNRTQLQQVIEEPAILSGNQITRRLSERLIHDITEGVDQLPILQHALNQIWHAADSGKEEMDLIHYAMVGGLSEQELPEEDVPRFKKWFEELPSMIMACYHEPSLQNVLDTHTNKLFEEGAQYYKEKTGNTISDDDAKLIITTAFTCLTKIDQSRAVRNRMTLQEITNILGRPEFDVQVVGAVLNIFREPGNTFIHPFLTDDPESTILAPDQVLDITHESLIRNWNYLEEWAAEEYHNYTISLDFEQQLTRWVESDYSNGFLLSIGPLTYFENWFNKIKPNAWWIARYLPEEVTIEKKLSQAKVTLDNAEEFLRRSARKHMITRTVIRYGPKRIAIVLGMLAILILSSFAVRDYLYRQNDYVLKTIEQQTFDLANNQKLGLDFAIPVITEQLMLGNLTVAEVVGHVNDHSQKIKIANGIATQLVMTGRNQPRKEIMESLALTDSLLGTMPFSIDKPQELYAGFMKFYDFSNTLGFAELFGNGDQVHSLIKNNASRSGKWVKEVLVKQPEGFNDMKGLMLALQNAINLKVYSQEEISELIKILSPFDSIERSDWVKERFQSDKLLQVGTQGYTYSFSGLYQGLAFLYASKGDAAHALQCIDSLLKYKEGYYQNDYATVAVNASHIAVVFKNYGYETELDLFVKKYCEKKGINAISFYHRLLAWALIEWDFSGVVNWFSGQDRVLTNTNLKFAADETIGYFYSKLRAEIVKIADADKRNYELALAYKNEALFYSYRVDIRGGDYDQLSISNNFAEAVGFYNKVSPSFLNTSTSVVGSAGSVFSTLPNKFLFLYPDIRVPFHPFEPRSILQFYQSAAFVDYVIENKLFDTFYPTEVEQKYFESWLQDYNVAMISPDFFLRDAVDLNVLKKIAYAFEQQGADETIDLNILYLHIGKRAFDAADSAGGLLFLNKVQPDKLLNAFQYKNIGWGNDNSLEYVGNAVANLTVQGEFDKAYSIINAFKKEVNRSSIYGYASQLIGIRRQHLDKAKVLLDSAKAEMNRIENPADFQPNRHQVAMALMYLDPEKNAEEAYRTIKNSYGKFAAISRFCEAHTLHGDLYKAQTRIPPLIASGDLSLFMATSIRGLNLAQPLAPDWRKMRENEFFFARRFLIYINENE